MIAVANLYKKIGDVQALDNLSLEAEDGQITGLLGPNGAGKTTCLRTIFGLLKADAGSATINGFDVAKQPIAAKRELGLFPDPFGIYERLTPREYIQYFAELSGLSRQTAADATRQVIVDLQLSEIADRRCKGFSQGQRMKTALAQAIVHRPKNIVLDEPTSGLDVMNTRVLRDVLRRLRNQGHCILFSSHVMQEVASLCDRVVVMANGRVMAVGSPQQLCSQSNKDSLEEAFISLIGTEEGIDA
ncbi:MAG: ATP-binding cassette domain-containing protein [Porticoccaceae bacterium]|nr:ATP-binding cassette domain-containing protein [Porticoccaceae bacterium]|tara:strand:- start:29938 stop:30672 length:735 start_codon:yes stop_codon:yes gene_type:complete